MPIKLTADSGAQVTACNVNKLSLLGLKRKDLLSGVGGDEEEETEPVGLSRQGMFHPPGQ